MSVSAGGLWLFSGELEPNFPILRTRLTHSRCVLPFYKSVVGVFRGVFMSLWTMSNMNIVGSRPYAVDASCHQFHMILIDTKLSTSKMIYGNTVRYRPMFQLVSVTMSKNIFLIYLKSAVEARFTFDSKDSPLPEPALIFTTDQNLRPETSDIPTFTLINLIASHASRYVSEANRASTIQTTFHKHEYTRFTPVMSNYSYAEMEYYSVN